MLYHKNIGMPKLNVQDKMVKLHYSQHAINESLSDKYASKIILPESINLKDGLIIELEVINNIPVKAVVRINYNSNYDLCLVIILKSLIVKTVWLNHVNDKHTTLNHSKYDKWTG